MKHRISGWLLTVTLLLPLPLAAAEWKDLYNQMILALLWHQTSDEAKALSWQTFNMARDIIDHELDLPRQTDQRPALVTDIDDTLVDASSYFAGFIGTNDGLNPTRTRIWWNQQPVMPRPGALAFLHHANRKGVEILYLTFRFDDPDVNRDTLNFLQRLGAPSVDPAHLSISEKVNKYNLIQQWAGQQRQLILTIGDKFSDLGLEPMGRPAVQHQWLKQNPDKPGQHHLQQANPFGGTWECLSHNTCPHSADTEIQLRRQQIEQLADGYTYPVNKRDDLDLYQAEELGQAFKWIRDSAEYPFITRQVYNRASLPWQQNKVKPGSAVVIDIDGTLLDLSPLVAAVMVTETAHKRLNMFHHWVHSARPVQAIPGARKYISAVLAAGGEVFFLTNRKATDEQNQDMRQPLIQSLMNAGLPAPDSKHLIMYNDYCAADGNCSKSQRLQSIRIGQVTGSPVTITQIIGDNLDDIELTSQDLDIPAEGEPLGLVAELGRTRFLLPNPLYTRGWLFRLYRQWHGESWPQISSSNLSQDRIKKLQRWSPDISMLE